MFCSVRLRDSRLGRAWIAIREDEIAAAAMGVPLMRTKTWSYATGAFFGGVAGAYFASFKSATFPDDFFFNISVFILCMIILGGIGNIPGVIFGACFLAYLNTEMLKKKSSGNVADLKLAKYAPATPPKKAPVAYDHVLVRISGTPIAAAAISSSRIAIHARPSRESRRRIEQNTVKRTSSSAVQ